MKKGKFWLAFPSRPQQQKMIGVSNKDGSFDVICAANSNLVFSLIGYEPKLKKSIKKNPNSGHLKSQKENVIEEPW